MVTANARARSVAALVERLNAAEQERDRLKTQNDAWRRIDASNTADRAALRAKVKQLRAALAALASICTACEAATATKHTEPDSPHDPLCQTCYSALWAVCGTCGAEVLQDELGSRQTCPASMGGPAEYADACSHCAPEGPDDDDRSLDDLEDR